MEGWDGRGTSARGLRVIACLLLLYPSLSGAAQETLVVDSLEVALADHPSRDTGRVNRLNRLGYEYWIINPTESVRRGTEALKLAEAIDYPEGRAYAQRVVGVGHWARGSDELAFSFLTRSRQLYETLADSLGMANCDLNLGMVYADQGNRSAAADRYAAALHYFESAGERSRVATTYTKMADLLMAEGENDTAFDYLRRALQIHTVADFTYGIGEVNAKLGRMSLENGDYDNAISHFLLAVKAGGQRYDHVGIGENFAGIGTAYLRMGRLELARDYLDRAQRIGEAFNLLRVSHEAYGAQQELAVAEGDYRRALEYSELQSAVSDSLYSQEMAGLMADYEARRRLEEQEEELALAQVNIDLLAQRRRVDRLTRWLLLTVLLLVSVFAYFLIYLKNRSLNRKQEDLDASLSRTDELATELRDRDHELAAHTLNLAHRNAALTELREDLDGIRRNAPRELRADLGRLSRRVASFADTAREWEEFRKHFAAAHPDLVASLKQSYPDLTQNEFRLIALLRLNLTSKEIGAVLGISPDSVKTARYRLRKKLNLDGSANLYDFLLHQS